MQTVETAESGIASRRNVVDLPTLEWAVQVRAIPPKLLRAIHGKATKGGMFDFNELMVWKLVYGLVDPSLTKAEAEKFNRTVAPPFTRSSTPLTASAGPTSIWI